MTPAQKQTRRRLALLFSLPLVFSVMFFCVDLLTERADIALLRISNLSSGIAQLGALAYDAQSGERGFLLTGDEHYLLPLEQASVAVQPQIDSCERYAKDEPRDLRVRVDRIVAEVKKRVNLANQVAQTARARGFEPALEMAKSNGSEESMNSIRRQIDELQISLNNEQSRLLDNQHDLIRWRFLVFAIGSAVLIVVMMWLYNGMLNYLHERDLAETKLREANEELEARIEERTRDLTQANEELQQFAYVASHDLQEPLRTITSFTQLLEDRYKGRFDEDADEFIGYIVNSARRMTDLINGLLAVARLRKSGQPTTPVSFEKLLQEAELSLAAAITQNHAVITHSTLPALVVDSVQFSQVFQNLISNAIKYRRAESPKIHVEAKRDLTSWVFSVRDNGQGFDQQFADRIFGLFQRLHGKQVEGTGMGLSIARKIVERHGGRIWAESKEGVGSTFYFSLPVSLELSHQPEMEESAEAKAVQSGA